MLLRKLLVQWGRHRGAQLLHLAHTDAVYYTSSTTAIAATTVIAATSITAALAACHVRLPRRRGKVQHCSRPR